MAQVQVTRLSSGPNRGKLRISITLDLDMEQELYMAEKLCDERQQEAARRNLRLGTSARGVGPVAGKIADKMVSALWKP